MRCLAGITSLNALAAVAIASDEGIADPHIVSGLGDFEGVSRRFQVHGRFSLKGGDFMLVDDYGHHPTEVKAVIEAVRKGWPDTRLVMVYQPHRYSRTLELFDQFVDVLSQVDQLVLLETYAAGEERVEGATGTDLYKQLELKTEAQVLFLSTIDEVPKALEQILVPGDFLMTQGAGETAKLARTLTERWERQEGAVMFRSSTAGSVTAILLVVGGLTFATDSIDRSNVDRISVVGNFDERQLKSIRALLAEIDIASGEVEQVKRALRELDWVHRANVRKNWPHAIEVEVLPERVIAYWNESGFISREGSVLYTEMLLGGDLPHLYGPAGSELNVMERFQQLSQMLNNYGLEIKALAVTKRGAWSLETENGVEVLLGKEDLKARMQRFLTVSVRLKERGDAMLVERIDARYINGVAVHFEQKNQMKFAEFNESLGERSL